MQLKRLSPPPAPFVSDISYTALDVDQYNQREQRNTVAEVRFHIVIATSCSI